MSLRVAVTGSHGFIGRHVMAALRARGDMPIPVPRPFTADNLAVLFRDVHVVVHLAGVISSAREREYHEGNVEATGIVARAADVADVRMVHISSLAAAGPAPRSSPRSEDDPPAPINTYGRTKLAGERALQALPFLKWTILRPGVVYGPGDKATLPLFTMARRGLLPLVGSPSAAYMFIYIDDAVRAILAAIDRVPVGTIFLGHEAPVSPRELLEHIRSASGSPARILSIPRIVTRAAAWAGDLAGALTGKPAVINSRRYAELYAPGFVCRVNRMPERLGLTATVGVRDGILRTARWYESEGWI